MSYSANICVISGYWIIFLVIGHVFLSVCLLGNLLLDARSNFTLLVTIYFCISIKILELCSGSKINYLEAVLNLLIFYGLLGETRPSSIQLIISPYWGKILLCTLPKALWVGKFFCLVGTVPSWLWAPGTPLILSEGSFPFLGSFSFTYALSRTHANTYRNPLQTLEFNLCVTFVSQVLNLANSSHMGSSYSYFHVLN